MDTVSLSRHEIDVAAAFSQGFDPSDGATACFVGTTRDIFDGKRVVHLEYEAYESMALGELRRLCESLRQKWPLRRVLLVHRVGVVPVSQPSVLVVASSVHRRAALQAVSYAIDRIKEVIPIWKKEAYDDGSYSWKENDHQL